MTFTTLIDILHFYTFDRLKLGMHPDTKLNFNHVDTEIFSLHNHNNISDAITELDSLQN